MALNIPLRTAVAAAVTRIVIVIGSAAIGGISMGIGGYLSSVVSSNFHNKIDGSEAAAVRGIGGVIATAAFEEARDKCVRCEFDPSLVVTSRTRTRGVGRGSIVLLGSGVVVSDGACGEGGLGALARVAVAAEERDKEGASKRIARHVWAHRIRCNSPRGSPRSIRVNRRGRRGNITRGGVCW